MTETTVHDYCRPFLFEHLGIRGAFVQLNDSWREMQAGRAYPSAVRDLLGGDGGGHRADRRQPQAAGAA